MTDEPELVAGLQVVTRRGFGVAHEFRGMKDVPQRTAFLVERGGTVRGAWLYETGEVPDFDVLLAAARAL